MTALMQDPSSSTTTPAAPAIGTLPLTDSDVAAIRAQFPVLRQTVYGKSLVYLDNGATTQKPQCVIDRMTRFYETEYGTVRRGVYALSEQSTRLFDEARHTAAQFINASSPDTVVFVRGCTEGINLVAHSYGMEHLREGDEILITGMEHHANIVPWQQVCQRKGCKLVVVPVLPNGELDLEAYGRLLTDQTRLVAVTHVSNVLGTINPIAEITRQAHAVGAKVLVDGAQSAPHIPVDVQALDCDFFVFSSHKLYGPTGIGVLYGKPEVLESMVPYQCGGDMIEVVTFEHTTFEKPPRRFEAGTPPIAEAIGLMEAIRFVQNIGLSRMADYEERLLRYATEQLQKVPGLRLIGTAAHKAAVHSFLMDSAHPLDIGTLLDHEGVAIRTGHHCAQPLLRELHLPATARMSLGIYNTADDVDRLVEALHKVNALCA